MSASTSDVLSAIKNIVSALNGATQAFLSVNGLVNASAIGAATVVKTSSGRLATVSVIVAGSTAGTIYDGATLTATTKPLWPIPNTTGAYFVNLPMSFGLVVSPGTGQIVTVGYS
jgi:hypothetical protein